jgi:hypothetical protein
VKAWSARCCQFCGKAFWAQRPDAVFCLPKHQLREWRAVATLAGTHGQVNGKFVRLISAVRP